MCEGATSACFQTASVHLYWLHRRNKQPVTSVDLRRADGPAAPRAAIDVGHPVSTRQHRRLVKREQARLKGGSPLVTTGRRFYFYVLTGISGAEFCATLSAVLTE